MQLGFCIIVVVFLGQKKHVAGMLSVPLHASRAAPLASAVFLCCCTIQVSKEVAEIACLS